MKQKYIILANSISYDKELEIEEADYTNSDLSDEDIIEELNDACVTLNQGFSNALVLTVTDADKLFIHLLGYKQVNKDSSSGDPTNPRPS
jgi:hypothetical protein